jgi:hypothetical protein
MGGKALNRYGVFTERKNTEEFNQIGLEIVNQLYIDLVLISEVIKCYHTKADHGDLDLLIKVDIDTNINWNEYIKTAFNPKAVYSNGGVHSFDYKDFQIDFIPIKSDKWEIAKTYFNYDPAGNIMGKTYHKFGLSYGWEGLFYKFRNFNGNNSADILLSTDARNIFEFGGYDYDRYLKGFDTLEDILKFTIDSKYFDSEMFKIENLKHLDRKRNRKRGSYHKFLEYLTENNIVKEYPFDKNKDNYLREIDKFFPEADLMNKLNALKEKDRINNIISQRFNGDLVMSWFPNLQGKELGNAMCKFKNALGEDYKEFVLNCTFKELYNRFFEIYNGKSE